MRQLIIALSIISILTGLSLWAKDCRDADRCLGAGGRWDQQSATCAFPPQRPADTGPLNSRNPRTPRRGSA